LKIRYYAVGFLVFVLIVSGCTTQTPATLDCSSCPVKTEVKEKIVEKEVIKEIEVIKYICSDGKEVKDKTSCIDYIDSSWDLSSNKEDLIKRLNSITGSLGFQKAVEVTKLVENDNEIEISYTEITANYQKQTVGQTMYSVLRETTKYLEENKKLDFNVKITTLTSNGGDIFTKTTSKEDILKILNYEIGEDEWINDIIS